MRKVRSASVIFYYLRDKFHPLCIFVVILYFYFRCFAFRPTEDITTFDRSSHFYERRDGAENYVRRPASAYHVVSPSDSLRGRTRERDRLYRNGPPHYTPILER